MYTWSLQKVEAEEMFKEIMAKSFPNLKKTADLESQATQQTLSTSNTQKNCTM